MDLSIVRRSSIVVMAAIAVALLVNTVSPRGIPPIGSVATALREQTESVGLEDAWSLFQTGRAVFVDARSEEEFCHGHIPGAILVAEDDFEDSISTLQDLIPHDALLITYCSGAACQSSREVAEMLMEAGYQTVKVFFGGWQKWKDAGHPIENSRPSGKDLATDLSRAQERGLDVASGHKGALGYLDPI